MAPRLSGGRGKFDLGQNATIDVTPLIGVMLLLLFVFMTAAPAPPRSIKFENAPNDWFGPWQQTEQVLVNLQPGNKLYIGSRPTSLETLVRDVGATIGGPTPTDKPLLLRADRQVPYGDFMMVMGVLKEAGYQVGTIVEDM